MAHTLLCFVDTCEVAWVIPGSGRRSDPSWTQGTLCSTVHLGARFGTLCGAVHFGARFIGRQDSTLTPVVSFWPQSVFWGIQNWITSFFTSLSFCYSDIQWLGTNCRNTILWADHKTGENGEVLRRSESWTHWNGEFWDFFFQSSDWVCLCWFSEKCPKMGCFNPSEVKF